MRLLLAKCLHQPRSAVWQFVYRMFGHGLLHTKTTQEDVLQELQHLDRTSRSGDTRMTRAFYSLASSKRLEATGEIKMLTLHKGILRQHWRTHDVRNDCFRARKVRKLEQDDQTEKTVVEKTVEVIKNGAQDSFCFF